MQVYIVAAQDHAGHPLPPERYILPISQVVGLARQRLGACRRIQVWAGETCVFEQTLGHDPEVDLHASRGRPSAKPRPDGGSSSP